MSDFQVMRNLVNGALPAPPDDLLQRPLLDQKLWALCQSCWALDTSVRPTALEAHARVREILTPVSLIFLSNGLV